jgi:hypothetical protein
VITLSSPRSDVLRLHSFTVVPQFGALINNLIVTTDKSIKGMRTPDLRGPAVWPDLLAQRSTQWTAVSRAWSMALRTSPEIVIQASIEYVVCLLTLILFICLVFRIGQSREYIDLTDWPILISYFPLGYWRNLLSSLDFDNKPLRSCVNIIHVDIVEIWNLYDKNRVSYPHLPCLTAKRNQYLSNNQFKVNMSHVVKDLAVPAGSAPPR